MRFLRVIRKVLKVLFLLLLIPLVPAAIWVICNQIDRAPSDYATTLEEPYTQTLPDERNAWLYMIGLGAEPGADPIAFGRKRVDAYLAHHAKGEHSDSSDAYADSKVPLPFNHGEKGSEIPGDFCRYRYADCVEWNRYSGDYIHSLVDGNTELLSRYETLLTMTEFEDTPFLRSDDKVVPGIETTIAVSALRSNRIALDVASGADPAKAAAELASDISFWQRLGSRARDPIFRYSAFAAMERNRRLLDEVITRSTSEQHAAMAVSIDQALSPIPASLIDARSLIRYKYQEFRETTRSGVPGFWASVAGCLKSDSEFCARNIGIALSFAPQASANQLADQYREAEALLDIDPPYYEAASSHYGSAMEDQMWLGDARKSLYFLLYNPAGKTLAYIAMPRVDLSMIAWDQEALRRMLVIKNAARLTLISPDRISEWLATQPKDLHNPWDDKPFAWNPVSRETSFAPRAKSYWKADQVHVGFESQKNLLIARCEHPMQITIEPGLRDEDPNTHLRTITCFSQQPTQNYELTAYFDAASGAFNEDPVDSVIEDSVRLFMRYRDLAVHADHGRIDIRVLQNVDKKWLAYELLGIDPQANPEVRMTPDGDPNGPELKVSFAPGSKGEETIAMYVRDRPSKLVMDELIRVIGIRLDNRQLVGSAPFSVSAEAMNVSDAIEIIADVNGLDVRKVGKNHFVFFHSK